MPRGREPCPHKNEFGAVKRWFCPYIQSKNCPKTNGYKFQSGLDNHVLAKHPQDSIILFPSIRNNQSLVQAAENAELLNDADLSKPLNETSMNQTKWEKNAFNELREIETSTAKNPFLATHLNNIQDHLPTMPDPLDKTSEIDAAVDRAMGFAPSRQPEEAANITQPETVIKKPVHISEILLHTKIDNLNTKFDERNNDIQEEVYALRMETKEIKDIAEEEKNYIKLFVNKEIKAVKVDLIKGTEALYNKLNLLVQYNELSFLQPVSSPSIPKEAVLPSSSPTSPESDGEAILQEDFMQSVSGVPEPQSQQGKSPRVQPGVSKRPEPPSAQTLQDVTPTPIVGESIQQEDSHLSSNLAPTANPAVSVLLGDSLQKRTQPRNLEKLTKLRITVPSRIGTASRIYSAFNSELSRPVTRARNMKDKLKSLVKKHKPRNLVVMSSVVDISNIKLVDQEQDRKHVEDSNKATLESIEQVLDENPTLHVTLICRPPRIDQFKKLNEDANLDLFKRWMDCKENERINLVDLKIDPKFSLTDCFGEENDALFDGVHWRGNLGQQAWNVSLAKALSDVVVSESTYCKLEWKNVKKSPQWLEIQNGPPLLPVSSPASLPRDQQTVIEFDTNFPVFQGRLPQRFNV